MSQSLEVTINTTVGLHARPATIFVKEAMKYQSKITVENLTCPSQPVNARSLLMVLSIGAEKGHNILLTIDGPDEMAALKAMGILFDQNFGEPVDN